METDHSALLNLAKNGDLSGKWARWKYALQDYDITLKHRAGGSRAHATPDFLLRALLNDGEEDCDEEEPDSHQPEVNCDEPSRNSENPNRNSSNPTRKTPIGDGDDMHSGPEIHMTNISAEEQALENDVWKTKL